MYCRTNSLTQTSFALHTLLSVATPARQGTMVAKWAFLCPKSKNGHNLKPPGIIFEDPLCPTLLGIIGHILEIEGILRKLYYASTLFGHYEAQF